MKPCIVCGQAITTKWSINRGPEVSVVDLCPIHERPLLPMLRAGLLRDYGPLTGRTPSQRVRPSKEKLFEALEWEPPSGTES